MAEYRIQGELQFNESAGQFCIVDHKREKYLETIDFGAKFEVLENDEWKESELAIGSNDKGEMVFMLKNTGYVGLLDGVEVRMR
ncbi:DUF5348 domain-containing protein [Treponema sp.]|uniref:DUF5348 domain-containing protein n=1 Tax=Treponema sp. TaxID=166 RepID=UPI00298D9316|nr:DUF5348 domain-containing protein [Treponema sp.]MCR5612684.1 DUF5348 domain-containing protein [Treponema sp.]